MKQYYVYIITNYSDMVFYIGVSNDIVRRIYEHKNKLIDGFTKKYNLNKLVYYEIYEDIRYAIAREKQLKTWSSDKKRKLMSSINNEYKDLYKEFV